MKGFSQGWLRGFLVKFSKKGHSLLRAGLAHRFHTNSPFQLGLCENYKQGATPGSQTLPGPDQWTRWPFYSMRPRDSFCPLQRASFQSLISITFKSYLSSTYKPWAFPPWPTLPVFLHCFALAWKVNILVCLLALAAFVLYSQPSGYLHSAFTEKRGLA